MRHVVAALIKAVEYIDFRTEEMSAEDDVTALEGVAYELSQMTEAEFREFALLVQGLKKADWLQQLMPGRFEGGARDGGG